MGGLHDVRRTRTKYVDDQGTGYDLRTFRVHVTELRSGHGPRPYAHVWTTLTEREGWEVFTTLDGHVPSTSMIREPGTICARFVCT
jgi:hypothetical protein